MHTDKLINRARRSILKSIGLLGGLVAARQQHDAVVAGQVELTAIAGRVTNRRCQVRVALSQPRTGRAPTCQRPALWPTMPP